MQNLTSQVKNLPTSPGVYLFKNETDEIIYIGKAKNLRSRVSSYFQDSRGADVKVHSIATESVVIEHMPTATELEAMLLEAKLIQAHQPRYNVMFKSGQPFVYLLATTGTPKILPELKLVRSKKQKGSYFGPFIEKMPARKVHSFLLKTFRLKLCGKKIENGCLYYHMGMCAGSCRPDFDRAAYEQRLDLAKKSLKQGHKKFLAYLKEKIDESNAALAFEQSRELHGYYEAFERVFDALDIQPSRFEHRGQKDVWVLTKDQKMLVLFAEQNNVLKKKHTFYLMFEEIGRTPQDYFLSYYRTMPPAGFILVNFAMSGEEKELAEGFLQEWHGGQLDVSIRLLDSGIEDHQDHDAGVMRMAIIQAEQDILKKAGLAQSLKRLLLLPNAPHSIDCFDISHKQGLFMVGSCIRFVDGEPDKNSFRRFKIKTVDYNNDYACLREVVRRRYHNENDLPDLILIDGGKGQLNAVSDLFEAEFASLAKREETVFSSRLPDGKVLDQKTYAAQVLMALRDYAHHFAVSYHRKLADF